MISFVQSIAVVLFIGGVSSIAQCATPKIDPTCAANPTTSQIRWKNDTTDVLAVAGVATGSADSSRSPSDLNFTFDANQCAIESVDQGQVIKWSWHRDPGPSTVKGQLCTAQVATTISVSDSTPPASDCQDPVSTLKSGKVSSIITKADASCTAHNEVGDTCSISCDPGQSASCQNGTGATPPTCECK